MIKDDVRNAYEEVQHDITANSYAPPVQHDIVHVNIPTSEIHQRIRDCILSTRSPMTTQEIITEIWGEYYPFIHKRSIVNAYIRNLRSKNLVTSTKDRPAKHIAIRTKNPLETCLCAMCGKDKGAETLDERGWCPTCCEVELHVINSTNGEQRPTRCPRVSRGLGVYNDPIEIEASFAPSEKFEKQLRYMNSMKGDFVRVIVTKTGKMLHGTITKVYPNAAVDITQDDGKVAFVNTTNISSIQPWDRKFGVPHTEPSDQYTM